MAKAHIFISYAHEDKEWVLEGPGNIHLIPRIRRHTSPDAEICAFAMMIKISVLRGIKLFYDIFFYKDSLFGESVCISIECYITQKAA